MEQPSDRLFCLGHKVVIFLNYTSEVMAQCRAFREVMQVLRDRGIKHTLRYPARLCIRREGEVTVIFNNPREATRFLGGNTAQEGE